MQRIEQRIDRALARCAPQTITSVNLDPADFRAFMANAIDNAEISLSPGRLVAPRYRDLPVRRTAIGSSHVVGQRIGTPPEKVVPILI